jgi:hypothetical protein
LKKVLFSLTLLFAGAATSYAADTCRPPGPSFGVCNPAVQAQVWQLLAGHVPDNQPFTLLSKGSSLVPADTIANGSPLKLSTIVAHVPALFHSNSILLTSSEKGLGARDTTITVTPNLLGTPGGGAMAGSLLGHDEKDVKVLPTAAVRLVLPTCRSDDQVVV